MTSTAPPAYTAPVIRTLAEIRPAAHLQRPALAARRADGRIHRWSGAQLLSAIDQARCALLSVVRVSAGRSVALSLLNGFEFVFSFLAVTNVRAIAAPLNPAYTQAEHAYYLKDMDCTALLVERGRGDAARKAARECNVPVYDVAFTDVDGQIRVTITPEGAAAAAVAAPASSPSTPLPSPQPSDVALILHTSGTTAKPKAVPLTHANLCRTLTNVCATYRLLPTDACMVVMPLFHVHGLMACLLSTLVSGGCAIVPEKFSAGSFWQDFADAGATWYSAVPTIHQILLARESAGHASQQYRGKLKFIRSCSSALAPATWQAMEDTFKVPIVEAYAMTEASHQMTSNDLPPGRRQSGSVGRGQGVDVAILSATGDHLPPGKEGEICVRGANVTAGYLNNPAANAESFHPGGFFRTGDQGYQDRDGFVYITGRLKELINRGGEKIAPLEVDAALLSHPGVAEAVAFGAPDEKYGQEVAAAVVPRPEEWKKLQANPKYEQELTKSIQAHVASRISAFKVPKTFFFNDTLPKTATGKIQRRNIASFFLEKQQKQLKAKL